MDDRIQDLKTFLLAMGPSTGKDIADHLDMSQTSFSRLINQVKDDILEIGQARARKYAWKRSILESEEKIPIYKIDENGGIHHQYDLHGFYPKGFYLFDLKNPKYSKIFDDLPYFLDDIQPAGFLGHLIPNLFPDLNLPKNIEIWSVNDCFRYWTEQGWNLVGNLIIGKTSLENYLKQIQNPKAFVTKNRKTDYKNYVDKLLHSARTGSSAGGEQPKFLISDYKESHHLFVKFSPPTNSKLGERRSDLLVCEHLAHLTLRKLDFETTDSRILITKDRTYLEMQRFDRVEKLGRKGIISLRALDNEFVGLGENWSDVAQKLFHEKLISKEILEKIYFLDAFGGLIANTDRHLGNISFFFENFKIQNLTPIYDMLPMFYAPFHEQILDREFIPPSPKADQLNTWPDALKTAIKYWKTISTHKWISKDFQKIAKKSLEKNLEIQNHLY